MKKIVLATKNKGKVLEIKAAFNGLPFEIATLDDFENLPDVLEDGATFLENACKKARAYSEFTGCACLADDSGLEVDALGGRPGVYSARFAGENATDAANNEKLIAELKKIGAENSLARFRCALAFIDTDGQLISCEGTCEGKIISSPRGENGFGYDPYFLAAKLGKTLAEADMAEKNSVSHRGSALKKMAERLAVLMK
jgi:XTP/dITP diphosphohydrolase